VHEVETFSPLTTMENSEQAHAVATLTAFAGFSTTSTAVVFSDIICLQAKFVLSSSF
jgi:hypothetical protein